jgi:DNA transposition AAA+ family ATPase
MLTTEFKQNVVTALKQRRQNYGGTDKGFAGSLKMHPTQWSRIASGNIFQVLADGQWIALARKCGLNLKGESRWKTAQTPVYNMIYGQLKKCQQEGLSSIFCDEAGVGKSHAAKQYAKENKYVAYIDCSQVKTKSRLVRLMAEVFGCESTGRYRDVYVDLCGYINSAAQNPLIILDEAGDLDYPAFLELKALWNATEGACGWYMMGADGLKAKINRNIDFKRVGFTELYSRYGRKYQRATPQGTDDYKNWTMKSAALIIKANAPEGTDIQAILAKIEGDLRRIPTELSKLKKQTEVAPSN